jgi:tetratricopeptide (TPR) repeat protein
VADICHNLAMAYRGSGREARALALWKSAATLRSKMGDLEGLAETQNSISATYKRAGRLPMALRHVRKARILFEMLGNQENLAYVLGNEADVLRRMNRADEAVELLDAALSRARSVGNLWLCSLISRIAGRCHEQLDDRAAAAKAYRMAYAFARANGDDDAARRSSNALAAVTAG